ncbi:U1 small nuclear ribonucleoprotein 70 kDa [Perkinsus olseni]|uniref:U1 small nuclear ribonucleoprotein 70 kDa n=1 Tax=Perkinsus olseni TaxID=32597 RepID=A0A7J6LQQ6_PEROL|nr:U1 small nuclear ribonucleoprotein 70 kDa [Perkinsus olseni]
MPDLNHDTWLQIFSYLPKEQLCSQVSPTCRKLCNLVRDAIESVTFDASATTTESSGTLGRYMIGVDPYSFPRVLNGTLAQEDYRDFMDDPKNPLTDANECSFRRLGDYANLKNLSVRNIFLSSIVPHFAELQVLRFEQCVFAPSALRRVYLTRCQHATDGRVPKRKRSTSEAVDRVYIGQYSDALLHLISAIGRVKDLTKLVMTECHLGALQKVGCESTKHFDDRRLSSGNPCLDFVIAVSEDITRQGAQPTSCIEKIPFAFLDGVSFNLIQTCSRLRNLQHLELDENCLFDSGVYPIAQSLSSGGFPALETLSLMGNYISTYGLVTLLVALPKAKRLTDVDLSDNQINFVARGRTDEVIDLDVPELMMVYVQLWLESSAEKVHLALAGNRPCRSVADAVERTVHLLEESKATEGILDFQQRSVRSSSSTSFQEDEPEGEDAGSLVADCGSDESVSEVKDGAASIGTPNGLGSSDDDDEEDGNPDLQIGMTALVGGDDSVPKRNPIWQLQNQEFQSDDEDDQDFDPTLDVSDDDALSGLVSEDDVI